MPEDLAEPQFEETVETARADGDDAVEEGDYSGPAGNGDLPKPLVDALKDVCRKMDQRELPARIEQVARCQKSRLFWGGKQFLEREAGTQGANGTVYTTQHVENPDDDPMYVFNIYLGYGKSFVASFAQAPVGVEFEANDPFVPSDVESAKEANTAARLVTKVNNQKDLQKQVGRLCWTDGLVMFYTRKVTNASKYGLDKDGQARSYPEIEAGGALEWKVPIASGGFDDWDYARHQNEIALTRAKADYPDKADELKAGNPKDIDYSRQARMSVAQGLGLTTESNETNFAATRTRYWLRPSAFWEITDSVLRGQALDYFPDGAYVCFIGETYVESRNETMDDHLVPLKAVDGDGFNTQGLGDTAIGPQETYNDLANLARVTFLRGVPHSFVDQEIVPPDALNNQKSTPGCTHPVTRAQNGEALSNHFHQETPTEAPVTMTQYLDNLQGPLSQFLTGQQPALFGGEMGEAGKTASGYQQALSQAMGLMGLVWVPFKRAWAKVMQQAVSVLGDSYPPGTRLGTILTNNNGESGTVSIDIDNLKGNFLCYPDTDENFPESWTAKKAAYQQLMAAAENSPELAAILMQPDNLAMGKDLNGLGDFVIPQVDSRDKQMVEIEEMENQPPVPTPQGAQMAQQAQVMGQPIPQNLPMQSSVDIDEFDDNATELATCVRWINSQAGQKAKRQKQDWYQNVKLHAQAHQQALQAQQQAPQQKPPSESINFKDLPPEGQSQMAGQAGIKLDPAALAAKAAQDQALAQQKSQVTQ